MYVEIITLYMQNCLAVWYESVNCHSMSNIDPLKFWTILRAQQGKSGSGLGGPDIVIVSFIIFVGKHILIPPKSFKKFIIASFRLETLAVAWLSIHIYDMCVGVR